MGLRINQNIAAMNAYRNLTVTDGQMAKSLEKLSSGFRINRAADDAAGLSISEGLRAQVGGTKVAIRNAQDGISVVQTAEGALSEVHSILQRMRDLAVQSSNTGSQDANAVAAAQTESDNLVSELNRISSTTSFGQTKLLDGTFGTQQVVGGGATSQYDFSAPLDLSAASAANRSFTIAGVGNLPTVTAVVQAQSYTTAASFQSEVNRAVKAALVAAGGAGDEVQLKTTSSTGTTSQFEFASKGNDNFTVASVGTVFTAQ